MDKKQRLRSNRKPGTFLVIAAMLCSAGTGRTEPDGLYFKCPSAADAELVVGLSTELVHTAMKEGRDAFHKKLARAPDAHCFIFTGEAPAITRFIARGNIFKYDGRTIGSLSDLKEVVKKPDWFEKSAIDYAAILEAGDGAYIGTGAAADPKSHPPSAR